jgi:hypothetical protein
MMSGDPRRSRRRHDDDQADLYLNLGPAFPIGHSLVSVRFGETVDYHVGPVTNPAGVAGSSAA